MIKWFRKLKRIVDGYDDDTIRLQRQIASAIKLIRSRTQIHADVHFRDSPNQIIVVGRYRNRDYFHVYSLHHDSLQELVDLLRNMEKYGEVKTIDAPIGGAAFVRESLQW